MLDEKNIGNDSSSLFNGNHFPSWASEASPTLGCSIEISRDICCRYVVCRMSVVCQITWNHVESHESNTRMLKVSIGL